MQAAYDAKNPAALKQPDRRRHPAAPLLYDDYSKFRDDGHLWFRFTEATFDNFMQTGREDKKAAPAKKK
jgi:hypothetical protein